MTEADNDWAGLVTEGTGRINDAEIHWRRDAGHYLMPEGPDGEIRARVFHVSYTRTDVPAGSLTERPVVFAVNGGPGSSSAFLHYGLLGPYRIVLGDGVARRHELVPNKYSILDDCDIVLLDPMSTGFTRAGRAGTEAEFHGVEQDTAFVADFVRWWLTRHRRWRSPRYLMGESYGGLRMCLVADRLQQEFSLFADGLILISPGLSLRLLHPEPGEDLPHVLALPTMALTAHRHGRANAELDAGVVRQRAESFALEEYASALLAGDRLDGKRRQAVAAQLAALIGLDVRTVLDHDLRIDTETFVASLFPAPEHSVARFDTRLVGPEAEQMSGPESDVSLRVPMDAYATVANDELSHAVHEVDPGPYRLINVPGISPWQGTREQALTHLHAGGELRRIMLRNGRLRVFVATGHYDLATPYMTTSWFLSHLGLSTAMRERVREQQYPAGHMMFIDEVVLPVFAADLRGFLAASQGAR